MECLRNPDFSKLYVYCMCVKTGSYVETGRDCPFDRITLLEKLMEIVANDRTTSWIMKT